jgi:hypothetical protein
VGFPCQAEELQIILVAVRPSCLFEGILDRHAHSLKNLSNRPTLVFGACLLLQREWHPDCHSICLAGQWHEQRLQAGLWLPLRLILFAGPALLTSDTAKASVEVFEERSGGGIWGTCITSRSQIDSNGRFRYQRHDRRAAQTLDVVRESDDL